MTDIDELRSQIEALDSLFIEILAKRQQLSKKIGQLKSHLGKEIIDPLREEKLFSYYENLSKKYQLQPALVKKIFKLIIADSTNIQKN
ncbi:MAG: chorismate mutase [Legionella sp.]|nr:chorismate mutase [Legionella sp.]